EAAPADAAVPPATGDVAKVNGTAITGVELTMAVSSFLNAQGMGPTPPPEQADQIRKMVLEALIGRELLYQYGVKEGIGPTSDEVDAALAKARASFSSDEEWKQHLASQGVTDDEAKDRLKRNLSIDKVVQTAVLDKEKVEPAEVRKYYDEHPDEMRKPEEIRASHILVRVAKDATDEARAAARAHAAEILAKARAGTDFAELARTESQDETTAKSGGDLGFFRRGMMVPAFETAAFALPVNGISDVVETPFGYHVIKVTDHHAEGQASFEEISSRLADYLKQKKSRDDLQAFVDGLRKSAQVQIF
ncbi:MAG TPA: peptidylprolyl isomerase, partial [Candidatus Saccharimonadales bacterium]|nr:peptidylprolyl isomerase [Candidatus Saccharimonadales bacterium]